MDRDFTMTDIAKNKTVFNEVCQLVSTTDTSNVISPISTSIEHGITLVNHFNFMRPDSNA
jgi:hypothetical protein